MELDTRTYDACNIVWIQNVHQRLRSTISQLQNICESSRDPYYPSDSLELVCPTVLDLWEPRSRS